MEPIISIRNIQTTDKEWLTQVFTEAWGSMEIIASQKFNALELPGFIAEIDNSPSGVLTYYFTAQECEIVTLNSLIMNKGIGTKLVQVVIDYAKTQKCSRVFVLTTNDNIEALRFYQKRRFRIIKIHPNAVEKMRKLKPQIPLIGNYGIPIKDAIELELIVS